MRSLLSIESFDLRPSNQYILMMAIPSCFRLGKMCLCQVSLLARCSPMLDLFCLRELDIVDVNRGTRSSSRGECDVVTKIRYVKSLASDVSGHTSLGTLLSE
jgi:hypothetical protein